MPSSPLQFATFRAIAVMAALGFTCAVSVAAAASLLPTRPVTAPDPAASPAGPEIISATDIPSRADADERLVQQIVQRSRQKGPTSQLVPALEQLTAGVRSLAAIFDRDEMNTLPVIRLESLDRHWTFYARQLDDWRRDLQRVTLVYSEDAAALSTRRATWQATSAVDGLAPALAARAKVIAGQVAVAERAISGPLDEQLKLGRKANALHARIDAGRNAVVAAIAHHDQRLYTVDVPPLWEVWSDPDYGDNAAASTSRAGLAIESQFLEEYVAAHRGRIIFTAALGLGLLPLLLLLSARSRHLISDDPALQASAHVLLRPLSAWLVVTLVAVPFVFPDGPLSVHQAALLLALIPVLRLLPREVYAVLGPTPYIVTGLYLLQRLGVMLLGHPLHYRYYLLAISLLTLLALAWLLVRRRPGTSTPAIRLTPRAASGVWRFAGVIAGAALIVAVIANVVGNVSLADVLTSAVVLSAYVGLALYAGASVLTSMLRLVLARKSVTRFRVVTQHTGPLLHALGRLIRFSAIVVWLIIVLDAFRVLRPVIGAARSILRYPLEAGHISITLGSILLFGFSVWIAFWFARSIRVVLQDEVLPKMALPRGVSNSISTLSYYALVTVGLLTALAASGFETSQFAIVFGALGVGIGFGLQDVVKNFVSGLILMFERPIQPGDVVEVSGTSGTVRDIGMRATTLTTFDGADVVVPNGTLLSEKLINWTLRDMNRRIDVDVGVAYGSDPRQVMELLTKVAAATPGISPKPEPAVVFLRFGANSLEFGIRAWTNDFSDWVPIRSQLTIGVYEALRAAGIEIPFPQHDVHLRSVSDKVVARMTATAAASAGPAPAGPPPVGPAPAGDTGR